MRPSLAVQTVDQLGGHPSVLVRQRLDHAELDALLEECLRSEGPARAAALRRTSRLVFSHAFAEEAVLWPMARWRVPRAAGLTTRIEAEHQEICELAARLDAAILGDAGLDAPGFERDLRRTAELLRRDARDEEDLLLPQLQDELGPRELRWLGRIWSLTRHVAPTRPHPTVSRRPPGNLLSALPLSVLDRARDRLDAVALTSQGPLSRWARDASGHLARAAGSVERLTVMQVGETVFTRGQLVRRGNSSHEKEAPRDPDAAAVGGVQRR
ncbi:MAG: hemerythrin domain-containing protein [Actinomycetota bacterium]|nr:hemerythrin domain-containing protein [Actinomycetota bacterium]